MAANAGNQRLILATDANVATKLGFTPSSRRHVIFPHACFDKWPWRWGRSCFFCLEKPARLPRLIILAVFKQSEALIDFSQITHQGTPK